MWLYPSPSQEPLVTTHTNRTGSFPPRFKPPFPALFTSLFINYFAISIYWKVIMCQDHTKSTWTQDGNRNFSPPLDLVEWMDELIYERLLFPLHGISVPYPCLSAKNSNSAHLSSTWSHKSPLTHDEISLVTSISPTLLVTFFMLVFKYWI